MEIKTCVSSIFASNTFVVVQNNSAIIIDAGCELNVVKQHTKGLKVEAVFITHLHYDHVYFLSDYVNEFKCKVYLYNSEYINNSNYTLTHLFGNLTLPQNCYVNLQGQEYVNVNGIIVMCYHTPGHSADGMCYQIKQHLFSGDTLFFGTIGRTDLSTSNNKQMLNSLEKLKTINFEICHSGHGNSSNYVEAQETIKYFIMEV